MLLYWFGGAFQGIFIPVLVTSRPKIGICTYIYIYIDVYILWVVAVLSSTGTSSNTVPTVTAWPKSSDHRFFAAGPFVGASEIDSNQQWIHRQWRQGIPCHARQPALGRANGNGHRGHMNCNVVLLGGSCNWFVKSGLIRGLISHL